LNKGWLFSHQLEGSEACLVSVLNKFKNIQSELIDEIKNILQELRSIPKEKQEKSFVLKDKLTNRFIEIFKSFEERIKIEFLKAALSGNFKFEENDIALPNKLMVVRYKNKKMSTTKAFLDLNNIDLDNSGIYDILKDDDYIRKLVESCRLSFRMQKTGTLRLDINSCNFTNDLLNEYNEFLNEDFFGSLQNLIKKGYEFAKDKIQKFFNFLIQLIDKGVSYFLDFFGIKIEPEFENEIIFP
jgi:hypothetical protein